MNDDQLFVNTNTLWRYFAKTERVSEEWNSAAFDDSQWRLGKASYGDGDDTTVLSDMYENFDKVYIRTSFSIEKDSEPSHLYMYFDDAFIVYINGKEVARSSVDSSGKVKPTTDP